MIKIGILTLSDRASSGVYDDKSGKAIRELLDLWISNEKEYFYDVIPDDFEIIREKLIELCDKNKCDLIVTTGGTGPAKRDVTPDATEAVCEKMMPGFGEVMRMESFKIVPTATLSRQTAGIRKNSFIINLPGNPKSIKECLEPVFPSIPYCIDLIGGGYIKTNEEIMKVFRPKHAIIDF